MSYATLNGKYIGVEPGTTKVYADRLSGGAWEELDVTQADGYYLVHFRTANLQLSIRPNGQLDTRPAGTDGAWEQLSITAGALFRKGISTILGLEGFDVAPPVQPPSQVGYLSRLRAERSGFVNREGKRVVIAGVSAFMHYERFLKGEDIRPLLAQAKDLGANGVRVFGMAHYIPVNAGRNAFKPQDYGDRYFDQIPDFCRLCAEYGQYVYWSVFPDNEMIGVPGPKGFMNRVVAKLKDAANTLGELTNEQDAHSFNHIDPASMDRPSGIAFCSGSYGDIGGAQPSPWDFCDYHQPRRYEPPTHIKDACVVDHPSYLQGHGVFLGEPDRYGTGGNLDQDQARLSAGASRESALGMVFHSTHGRESLRYDDATMAIGRIFLKALVGVA